MELEATLRSDKARDFNAYNSNLLGEEFESSICHFGHVVHFEPSKYLNIKNRD